MNIPLMIILTAVFLAVIWQDLLPLFRPKPAKGAVVCALLFAAAMIPALLFAAGINVADYLHRLGGFPR